MARQDDEDDDFQLGDLDPGAAQQEDLYDYRKARVTPLDWPAYKWPSVTELAAAQKAALDGQDVKDVDLAQVPSELHKWAKDNIVFEAHEPGSLCRSELFMSNSQTYTSTSLQRRFCEGDQVPLWGSSALLRGHQCGAALDDVALSLCRSELFTARRREP